MWIHFRNIMLSDNSKLQKDIYSTVHFQWLYMYVNIFLKVQENPYQTDSSDYLGETV